MKIRLAGGIISAMIAGPLTGALLHRLAGSATIDGVDGALSPISATFSRHIKKTVAPRAARWEGALGESAA